MDPSLSSISPSPPTPPIVPVIATTQTTTIAGGLPPSFSHPPYSDMICEAIGALKENDGSSKKAIAKYIESTFKDLPPSHSALLTHHLKSLKNSGVLVMAKKSYKLASTVGSEAPLATSDVSTGPKRGRGRPPKPKTADSNSQQHPVSASVVAKRFPGRPKKSGPAAQFGVIRIQGRGRPGRPKKPKTVKSVVGSSAMKRSRGRPPKVSTHIPPEAVIPNYGQPVAVPYADSAAVTADVGAPRPRGRPKGTTRVAAVVSLGKRRGRPPKIAGVTVKPMKTTGKPVGRPRKTTDGAESESKALAAAHEDFKKKLEFFQLKVKQAVEALKPLFTSESNSSAVDAVLELEGLAAMEL